MGVNLATGIASLLPWLQGVGSIGLLALACKLYVDRARLKLQATTAGQKHDLDVEVHRDSLTIQLLETAREEIAVLKLEMERHRASETHVLNFQTSLDHLEAVLLAETPEEATLARRNAQAFLNRMKRLQEARGTITNELQRLESDSSLREQRARKEGGDGADRP